MKLSSVPEDPHIGPPSYSLLGVLLGIRLLHRLLAYIQAQQEAQVSSGKGEQHVERADVTAGFFIDEKPVLDLLNLDPVNEPTKPAEEDERTILEISKIPQAIRTGRNCTLCLEERTDSCSTECGHLFCWNCIVGWGREKVNLFVISG